MRIVMAKSATDSLARSKSSDDATRAAQSAVNLLKARGKGTGGIILLDKAGNPGIRIQHPAHGIWLRRLRIRAS